MSSGAYSYLYEAGSYHGKHLVGWREALSFVVLYLQPLGDRAPLRVPLGYNARRPMRRLAPITFVLSLSMFATSARPDEPTSADQRQESSRSLWRDGAHAYDQGKFA